MELNTSSKLPIVSTDILTGVLKQLTWCGSTLLITIRIHLLQ